jgi:NAD(P) transhydrogenase
MQNTFDLAVIGAGPAGIVGATTAAFTGARVALIDRHGDLGGAGANTGTVPSKTLRETALALTGTRSRELYGVDLSLRREATIADLMRRERAVKEALNRTLSERVAESATEVIVGDAHFQDDHTIAVRDSSGLQVLSADRILIATGSSPNRPDSFPFDAPGIYDSDTILELNRIPRSLAVVGAGAVGSEYACTFGALGSEVHLIDGRATLLPFLDSEVSQALTSVMSANGTALHLNERVAQCRPDASGVELTMKSGRVVRTEALLVAAGRISNTAGLNLAAAGLAAEQRGELKVDEHYRTAIRHIYAVGDVIGFPGLASTGMQQARRAMSCAFGPCAGMQGTEILPAAVYTIPEVGMAGETEQSLRAAGVDYVVGRARYDENARGCIVGDRDGFLKLIFRHDDLRLLGVHAIGELASELVHIGLIVMAAGGGAETFSNLCFNVPTLGGLYQDATWRLINASQKRGSPRR